MILIPVEIDERSIARGFKKAAMFVFIDSKSGIIVQENHFKTDNSTLFFENFKKYDVDSLYIKSLGYQTYLKLEALGIKVYLIPAEILVYTYIDPNELIQLNSDNAQEYCTLGHTKKETY